MKSKKSSKVKIIWGVAFLVFGLGAIFAICDLGHSVGEAVSYSASKTPEAILASSKVSDGGSVSLPVSYFDQRSDDCVDLYDLSQEASLHSRQFEWTSCGYYNKALEQGIVDFQLGEDYYPVAIGGRLTPNRGVTDFKRWFNNVEGKSQNYSNNLTLNYSGSEFSYFNDDFYPLDQVEFSKGDVTNQDGHNHLFTMALAAPFRILKSGDENFEITADDDTFVFVGDKLALDMGGVHGALKGKITIDKDGKINTAIGDEEFAFSGISIDGQSDSVIRIFHADRDSSESVFKITFQNMSLNIVESQLAGAEVVQIAYDPTDPTYVAPLGETAVSKPDVTREYIVIATIEVFLLVAFVIFVIFFARSILKNRK